LRAHRRAGKINASSNLLARSVAPRKRQEDGLQAPRRPRIAVVMGVSGAGKTTIGVALAHRLGWRFQEGDALHPPENVAKMNAGIALDDADRAPWLHAVAARIDEWRERGEAGVVTCSALKRKYRDVIVGDRPEMRLVHLTAPPALIAERLAGRHGHFMPASLLQSQLATLEPPDPDENALTVAVDAPVEIVVERIAAALTWLNLRSGTTA
jgi:carbohydrate kinase (thermoresistant glucokinase family)